MTARLKSWLVCLKSQNPLRQDDPRICVVSNTEAGAVRQAKIVAGYADKDLHNRRGVQSVRALEVHEAGWGVLP